MNYMVFITCADKKEAGLIANSLVKQKLAACVTIVGAVDSLYWWKGKIERSKEVLLTAKTTKKLFNKLVKQVKSIHSYEVPEIIALPIVLGSLDYMNWIEESVR